MAWEPLSSRTHTLLVPYLSLKVWLQVWSYQKWQCHRVFSPFCWETGIMIMLNTDNDPNKLCNWQQVLSFEWEVYWMATSFELQADNYIILEAFWFIYDSIREFDIQMNACNPLLNFRFFEFLWISKSSKNAPPVFWGSVFLVFKVKYLGITQGRLELQVVGVAPEIDPSCCRRFIGLRGHSVSELKSDRERSEVRWRGVVVFLDPYPFYKYPYRYPRYRMVFFFDVFLFISVV